MLLPCCISTNKFCYQLAVPTFKDRKIEKISMIVGVAGLQRWQSEDMTYYFVNNIYFVYGYIVNVAV